MGQFRLALTAEEEAREREDALYEDGFAAGMEFAARLVSNYGRRKKLRTLAWLVGHIRQLAASYREENQEIR
jgi:hypothetical protein